MKKALYIGLAALGFLAFFLYIHVIIVLLDMPSDLAIVGAYFMIFLLGAGVVMVLRSQRGRYLNHMCLMCMFLFLGGCYKIIPPGHIGIVVKQTGGDRGVQDIPVQTGRVFYNPMNEDVLDYPTFVQRAIWTSSNNEGKADTNEEISFQSSDSLHFTGDVAVAYQLEQKLVPHFYVQFRSDDLLTFTHGFFRDGVRKAIGIAATHYTAEQINGGKQAALEAEAQDALGLAMGPFGVTIRQLAFTSPPRPPDQVRQAIQMKIAAIQDAERSENQKRFAIAEGEKMKAMAAATAQSNALVNSSITPQLIQWRYLDILGNKWDGHYSLVQGGGSGMLLNVPIPPK